MGDFEDRDKKHDDAGGDGLGGFDGQEFDFDRMPSEGGGSGQSASSNGFVDDAYDPWSSGSAFSDDPIKIVEAEAAAESDGDGEDSVGDKGGDHEPQSSEKPKGKVNPVILAVAGLLGLGVLGGAGYMGYSMLAGAGSPVPPMVAQPPANNSSAAIVSQPPVAETKGVNGSSQAPSALEVVAAKSDSAGADIFGDGRFDSTTPAAAQNAGATPAGATSAAAAQTQVAASQQAQEAMVAGSKPSDGKEASGQAAAATHEAQKDEAKISSLSSRRGGVKPSAADDRKVVQAAAAKAQTTGARQPTKMVKAKMARAKVAKRVKSTPKEEYIDNISAYVVAVYPQTGKFAQAWVRQANGVVFTLREGDLYNGARVRRVEPEKMRVLLEDGRVLEADRSVRIASPG